MIASGLAANRPPHILLLIVLCSFRGIANPSRRMGWRTGIGILLARVLILFKGYNDKHQFRSDERLTCAGRRSRAAAPPRRAPDLVVRCCARPAWRRPIRDLGPA